jgi:hypothetical protein
MANVAPTTNGVEGEGPGSERIVKKHRLVGVGGGGIDERGGEQLPGGGEGRRDDGGEAQLGESFHTIKKPIQNIRTPIILSQIVMVLKNSKVSIARNI